MHTEWCVARCAEGTGRTEVYGIRKLPSGLSSTYSDVCTAYNAYTEGDIILYRADQVPKLYPAPDAPRCTEENPTRRGLLVTRVITETSLWSLSVGEVGIVNNYQSLRVKISLMSTRFGGNQVRLTRTIL